MAVELENVKILEYVGDKVFILDRSWQFIYLNEQAELFFGKSSGEILGKTIWEQFPQLDNSLFAEEYRRVMTHKVSVNFEAWDGLQGCWLEVVASPYQEGIAVCLRNINPRKQVEADLLERTHLTTLEAQISKVLVTGGELRPTLEHCTQIIVQQLNVAIAGVWTYSSQMTQLELQGINVHQDAFMPKNGNNLESLILSNHLFSHRHVSLEDSAIGLIAQKQEPIINLPIAPSELELNLSPSYSQSLLCQLPRCEPSGLTQIYFTGYPLIVESQLVGVLGLWSALLWSDTSKEAIASIAENLAIAIDRYWAKLALLSRREALLFRLANQIRNSLDLNTVLGIAVSETRTLLKVDHCFYLWCWSQPGQVSVMVSHEANLNSEQPSIISSYPPDKLELLGERIQQLQSLRIDDLNHDTLPFNEDLDKQALFVNLLQDLGITSIIMMPLRTRSEHLGAIVCTSEQTVRNWSNQDLELLQGVVDQLAIAIDQAEVFAQARATALAAQTQAQQLQLTLQELKQAQAQLVQTEKMSSLGQMVAGIAHEINNPVNFISGNLTYTREYVEDLLELVKLYREHFAEIPQEIEDLAEEVDLEFIMDDLPKLVASMQMGAERIKQIVLSLRNFSRLDQADKKPADIHEGIDSTILILHNRLKAQGEKPEITITKNYSSIPPIECYPGQLNQVFMNILSNAIDALENQPDTPTISITTELIPDPSKFNAQSVIIRFKDNGSGMTEDTAAHIFDPFFTTKPVGKGTGLGLSISYQIIVEKHEGTIECLSEPGAGTEFVITIPFKEI